MSRSRLRSKAVALVAAFVLSLASLLSPILLATPARANPVAPQWPACALFTIYEHTPFSAALGASDATSYTLLSGILPSGITLDPTTGILSGTTEEALGFSSIEVRAANASGTTDQTIAFQIVAAAPAPPTTPPTVPPGSLVWDTTTLAAGERGRPYSATLTAENAQSYTVTPGASLPDGLTLDGTTGALCGTPTAIGDFSFTVTAINDSYGNVDQVFTLAIAPPAPVWHDSILADAVVGTAYNDGVAASDTDAYAITAGALPSGLILDAATGRISGTPQSAGLGRFTITASNSASSVARDFTLRVTAAFVPPPPVPAPVVLVPMPTVSAPTAPSPTGTAAPAAQAAATDTPASKPASGGFGGLGLIVIVAAVVLGGGLFAGFGGARGGKSSSGL